MKTNTLDTLTVNEINLVADICKESLFEFTNELWDSIVPEPLILNWHIEFLCDELQKLADRMILGLPKEYDLIVNIPPGTTKSTICSVMFPAWLWTRMPSARCICASYTHALAMDLSRKSRDVVASGDRYDPTGSYIKPGYSTLFPDVMLRADQNTKSYFANTKGGMRYAVGIGGSVTGMHGHMLLVDDPLDPNEAASEVEIKRANEWMGETLPSRKVNKKIVPTVLIQQRLHQNDPTGNRIEKGDKAGKFKLISLPADSHEFDVYPPELEKYYVDGLLDPNRMPRDILQSIRGELGEYGYAGQFGQTPVPRGGLMFEVEKMQIAAPPNMKHFKRLVRYWDKAATHKAGAFTVGCLMGLTKDGVFWVLDIVRGQWSVHERERVIERTAKADGRGVVIGVEQEPGGAGKESAQATARMLRGFRVKLDKVTGDKVLRAEPYADQVGAENVYIAKAHWNLTFLEEHRFFPESTYKDQVDASSGAFNQLAQKKIVIGSFDNWAATAG